MAGSTIVDCGLHWGDLVASQLFEERVLETNYSGEDSPSSCPSGCFWVGSHPGSLSLENEPSSPGLLGVGGEW